MTQKLKQYPVEWYKEARCLDIPVENVDAEIKMTDFPPLANPWQSIVKAMENPIDMPPLPDMLKPRSTVVLLTGDRFTDQMLGDGLGFRFLDYLNKLGIKDEDVTLVYAPGSHHSPVWRQRLGPDLLKRVKAIRHDCFDESNLAYLGVTSRLTPVWINKVVVEADFRIGFGEISPSLQGGWCGGGKIILPGVAGWDTITQNHFGVVKAINPLGLADGNHMRLDMEEGARMANLELKIDVLVDRQARIVDVFAGDFVAEHRAALNDGARDIWMTKMSPADVYVLYPGEGSEQYLSSAFFIRMEGAELGTKDDGIIILAMSAAGGWAPPDEQRAPGPEMTGAETAAMFKGGTEAMARQMVRSEVNVRTASNLYVARRVLERRKVFLVCDGIQPTEAVEFGFDYCTTSFDDALARAFEDRGKAARVAVNIASNAVYKPIGRPVAWRAMPWRDG